MINFDRIDGNFAYKEVALYSENNLVIGYRIDRYKKNKAEIFEFDKTVKQEIF